MSQNEPVIPIASDLGPKQREKVTTLFEVVRSGCLGPSVPPWAPRGMLVTKEVDGELTVVISEGDGIGGEIPVGGGGSLVGPFRQAAVGQSAFDWPGIPAGVKEIVLVLDGATLSGAGDMLVQLGTSAGLVETGYNSTSYRGGSPDTSSAGMLIHLGSSGTRSCYITMSFHLSDETSNRWNQSHCGTHGPDLETFGAGGVALPGAVDRLRLTRVGSDTFTAGAAALFFR